VIRNAGSATIDGLEADLTWRATEGLTVSGGFSWLDAKLSENYVPDPDAPPEAFKGDRLPVTPEFKANLTGRYEFPVGTMNGYFQAAAVYNGDTYSDLTRFDRATFGKNPSYTLVDLSGGVNWGNFSVDLYINNAFDELSRTAAFAGCVTDQCGVQPYYVTNQPRTIGLKFSQQF
jgi:outer membrane receptor protein involved in Fe transport